MATMPRTRPRSDSVPTLPGRYYYDPDIYALEQERIFAASWICVGRPSTIAAPGAYFLAMVAGESLIVLRDRADAVRAFHNVCRHRGARICTAARGELKSTISAGTTPGPMAWTASWSARPT